MQIVDPITNVLLVILIVAVIACSACVVITLLAMKHTEEVQNRMFEQIRDIDERRAQRQREYARGQRMEEH